MKRPNPPFLSFHLLIFLFASLPFLSEANLGPKERLQISEKHVKGDSFQGHLEMSVNKNGNIRKLEILSWLKGDDQSLIRIINPPKERGTGTLRIHLDLWQYLPKVNRVVKIPPSMMLQSWMGSDFSNDDLVKSSSLARDYTHKVLGEETLQGQKTIKIECLPKKDAPIVWGKVIAWVRASDNSPMKQEYFTEKGKLVKTLEGFEHKTFGKRTLPTRVVMTPADSKGNQTILIYKKVQFDHPLKDSLFTQNQLQSEID